MLTVLTTEPGDIALTEIGLEVARRAEHILAATRDLVDFASHRNVLTGVLRLGIIPTLAPYVLPRLLPQLQIAYPQLALEMRETQTKVLLEELADGRLDTVMLALPTDGADVETLALFRDSLVRGGFLCLGTRESLDFAPSASGFAPVDAARRIYRLGSRHAGKE